MILISRIPTSPGEQTQFATARTHSFKFFISSPVLRCYQSCPYHCLIVEGLGTTVVIGSAHFGAHVRGPL